MNRACAWRSSELRSHLTYLGADDDTKEDDNDKHVRRREDGRRRRAARGASHCAVRQRDDEGDGESPKMRAEVGGVFVEHGIQDGEDGRDGAYIHV